MTPNGMNSTGMNPNDVIDAYLADVIRRVPGKDRDGIGLELRGLLAEMLADRAQVQGRAADDAMVLACFAIRHASRDRRALRPPGLC